MCCFRLSSSRADTAVMDGQLTNDSPPEEQNRRLGILEIEAGQKLPLETFLIPYHYQGVLDHVMIPHGKHINIAPNKMHKVSLCTCLKVAE